MQAYSDPKRASDPYALPDVEVFEVRAIRKLRPDFDYKAECGHFVCLNCLKAYYPMEIECEEEAESSDCCSSLLLAPGWYYWYCLPGCLPDSEPIGPFETKEAALEDAQQDSDE